MQVGQAQGLGPAGAIWEPGVVEINALEAPGRASAAG